MPTEDEAVRAEANRLYWESDASVAEIAEGLGLSRRGLYEAVQPIPAGVPCPECDADMVFVHRLARTNREAVCPECGTTVDAAGAKRPTAGGEATLSAAAGDVAEAAERLLDGDRKVLLTGAAIAGLAVGIGVALLVRRR